jgi:hypothetical protein
MTINEYRFVSHWRVEGTIEEVSDVLHNEPELLLKPVFSANHRWAMARGEESFKAELGRRASAGQQSGRQTS